MTVKLTWLIYLASPYSDPSLRVQHERFKAVSAKVAEGARAGLFIYSPIAHWHPIAVAHRMPTDFTFYKDMNEIMLVRCDEMAVLMLDGWKESKGIQHEIEFCATHGIPVSYIKLEVPWTEVVTA